MSTPPHISLVIPIYNEEVTISQVIPEAIEILQAENHFFEIVAVDDGSSDRSFQVLRSIQEHHPDILRIVQHIYNKGYGAALRTGIRCARGELVVCMDADGQHSASQVANLIALIPPYDLVVGYRTSKYQGHWYRNLGNRFYNSFASWLTGFKILDLTSGFRAMRRSTVNHFLHLYPSGFSASLTVTMAYLKAGYNVTFVPVDVQARSAGESKVNYFKDGSRFFNLILRMVMLYDPMRIFTPASLLSALLGVVAWIAGMLDEQRFFFSNATILFFVTAIFIFLLGLIANQVVNSRIHYYGDDSIRIYDNNTPGSGEM
jgi:glycosyltransferase involved in cell wall biosynthesis